MPILITTCPSVFSALPTALRLVHVQMCFGIGLLNHLHCRSLFSDKRSIYSLNQ